MTYQNIFLMISCSLEQVNPEKILGAPPPSLAPGHACCPWILPGVAPPDSRRTLSSSAGPGIATIAKLTGRICYLCYKRKNLLEGKSVPPYSSMFFSWLHMMPLVEVGYTSPHTQISICKTYMVCFDLNIHNIQK